MLTWRCLRGGMGLLLPIAAVSAQAPSTPTLQFDYSLEYRRNLSGGQASGGAWLDQLLLSAADPERWQASVLATNSHSFSEAFAGDLQTASNVDAGHTLRLYEAWWQQRFAGHRLLVGLYDLNSEFDAIENAGWFHGSSHGIGPDLSQSGQRGPSIFPHPSLALRLDGRWGEQMLWRIAALDALPGDPDDPARTAIELHSEEGALLIGEVEWQAGWRWAGGAWRYSKKFERIDGRGQAAQQGWYGLTEGTLFGSDSGQLSGWLRVGMASPSTLAIATYLGAGMVWAPADSAHHFGMAIAQARLAGDEQDRLRAAGERPAGSETAVEWVWHWQVSEQLTLQPDLQWIRHPGALASLDDAWVVGLRVQWVWG